MREINDPEKKVEHLITNRLHMKQVLGVGKLEEIEEILNNDFENFEENIGLVQKEGFSSGLPLICLISWLKYYAQLYTFALNRDSHNEIMPKIDRSFTNNESSFCTTLKVFVIKQLCQISKVNFNELRNIFFNRNLLWIRPLIDQSSNYDDLILPIPLFEGQEEFKHVQSILINVNKIQAWRQLINECSNNQKLAYGFILWFIHQYFDLHMMEKWPYKDISEIIKNDLCQELNECFSPIGYKLLVSLCTNFKENSYFRLRPTTNNDEIYRRMVALNIAALLISCKALRKNSYLGNFLFNSNQEMPENYTEHVQKKIRWPSFLSNDPFVTQMKDVCEQVTGRLLNIEPSKRFIYQCSDDCPWIFYFEDCGAPNDHRLCPMCNKDIGAIEEDVLIERDPPQLKISIDDGFEFISNYIEDYNRRISLGYHDRKSAEQSNVSEKPDHLKLSISYRFIHMFIHATLLFLNELDYLPDFDLSKLEHFREHFEKDYSLLVEQVVSGDEQCYIWLFKLINHMLDEKFIQEGLLDNYDKVVKFETHLEQQLILPHLNSIVEEIHQYKVAYMDFLDERTKEFSMEQYIDEVKQDEERYPFLSYFNVTNVHTADPLNEFSGKIQLLPHGNKTYPMTMFLLKRIDDYANIQYLYPIVAFTSHLMQKFNHRIKRNDASTKTISDFFKSRIG